MKQFFLERYKILNSILFVVISLMTLFIFIYITQGNCVGTCEMSFKKGFLNPLYSGGKWLAITLGLLLLFPSRFFKKWLFFVLPIPLIATYILVTNISVYGGGVLYISRADMAANGMIALAIVTVVFVAGHSLYDWKIRGKLSTNT